jgi:cytidine deaminase
MKDLKIITKIKIAKNIAELPEIEQKLLNKAKQNLKNAYAPYSNFHVAACILLANGKMVTGTNQENASYPIGLCAERVAIAAATALYPNIAISAIAITVQNMNSPCLEAVSPCGTCRQVILEQEQITGLPIKLLLKSEADEVYIINSIVDLLPLSFNKSIIQIK